MKVNSTIYKGIEYIQVRELPPDQQESLLQSIKQDQLIKILVEGKLVGNCLLFKDYETWFDTVYNIQTQPLKTKNASGPEKPVIKMETAKRSKKS